MERGCGILLPISSLPNKYGFGCFSKEAYDFVDFLSELGIKYWQILPLGIVDRVGSPYSSVSAFAGEPLYIDLERYFVEEEIEFFKLNNKLSFDEYRKRKDDALHYLFDKMYYSTNIDKFIEQNEYWVYDYAVYRVLKDELDCSYIDFPDHFKSLDSKETIEFIKTHSEEIIYYIFLQYIFFKQWKELKKYANSKGIKIIGDVPIYASMDSADMYSKPQNFLLDKDKKPEFVAGVPGDYFNKNGQIWNNPLYNYEYMKKDNFSWWVERLKHLSKIYDYIRIDHFRGFESYFAIPYGENTINNGKWCKGPGIEIFEAFKRNYIRNLILEDLGDISDDVRELKKQTGLAGMKVLQFAFDGDLKNTNLPHEYEKNSVAYLGTHDNDTFVGFLKDKNAKTMICKYLNLPENTDDEIITRMAIENLVSTNSDICVLTMQDLLCEGSSDRINTPGTVSGNWEYRLKANYQESKYYEYFKQLIKNKNR